jgi:hypothetical protein
MPSGLDISDRKLLVGAAALTMLLTAGTVAFSPAAHHKGYVAPSTYSSDSGGARAPYLLLLDLHYAVRRWEEPPAGLANLGRGSVLILAEPTGMPAESEKKALRRFVRGGGRILFCGSSIASFFPEANVSEAMYGAEWKEFTADLPSYYSRGAQKIVIEPKAFWKRPGTSQLALYGDPDSAAVVAWRMGSGEVLWWAGATPLTNAGIRKAGNLRLFLNAVSGGASGSPETVYWDEYFHGQRASLWSYVAATPISWGLLQLGLIAAAVLFTFSRRWGPIAASAPVSRLSPLEFVQTLGGLYERAGATAVAVDVAYRNLRLTLTQQLAMPGAVQDEKLARAAEERLGWSGGELKKDLDTARNAAAGGKLSPKAALQIVQRMGMYIGRLAFRRTNFSERH